MFGHQPLVKDDMERRYKWIIAWMKLKHPEAHSNLLAAPSHPPL
jgi:hypothetical protein